MKPKETINLYRVISLLVIALVTFGVMGGLCAKSHLYPDEWLSMFFLTLIFLLACMFELEYERKQKGISANTQTTFIRLSVTYTVSGGLIYAISYLPEFYSRRCAAARQPHQVWSDAAVRQAVTHPSYSVVSYTQINPFVSNPHMNIIQDLFE